jgi:hypothetical protein
MKEMLKEDGVFSDEVLGCLSSFKNLKSIKLLEILFQTVPMPNIEKLKIKQLVDPDAFDGWASSFPNVKNLTLINNRKLSNLENLPKLETLEIREYFGNFISDEFLIPSTVKNLTLFDTFSNLEEPFIFDRNHQIETFKIKDSFDTEWVCDFLRSLRKKLKFLWIDDCTLSDNRKISRLFELEPELMNKAEIFIYNE